MLPVIDNQDISCHLLEYCYFLDQLCLLNVIQTVNLLCLEINPVYNKKNFVFWWLSEPLFGMCVANKIFKYTPILVQ